MNQSPGAAGAAAAGLKEKLEAGQAVVAVVGLGYVGLPLALAFAARGTRVVGFDVDAAKTSALERGESYIGHIAAERVRAAFASGLLAATTDFARLSEADAIIVCVPTPLTAHREPDLSYVLATGEQIARCLRPGQLVVLESTTYPGTTDEALLPLLERSGLRCGSEFFVAFSPERENPGDTHGNATLIPKVVGGVDQASGDLAELLYRGVVPKTVRVSSARVAEACKITENVFRAVNIALVNELKVIYDRMGIDVREVLDAAATKPFGFMRFDPGPGWGGHCIPVDPFYLSWKAREFGHTARFVELAGTINVEMPLYVLGKLQDALNRRGKPLRGSRVLVLGLAYKPNVDDPRESPAFEVIHLLLEREAVVSYHDPFVPVAPRMRSWPALPGLRSLPLAADLLRSQDAVVVVTAHDRVDYALVLEHAPLIVDARGVYRAAHPRVVKA